MIVSKVTTAKSKTATAKSPLRTLCTYIHLDILAYICMRALGARQRVLNYFISTIVLLLHFRPNK